LRRRGAMLATPLDLGKYFQQHFTTVKALFLDVDSTCTCILKIICFSLSLSLLIKIGDILIVRLLLMIVFILML
jgi:hypothetical protein